MTFAVAMAARPVSAEPSRPTGDPTGALAAELPRPAPDPSALAAERARVECGVYRVCCFVGARRSDPLAHTPAPLGHRALVGIPQTQPGGLAHPVVKRFIAHHADELARCYPRRIPARAPRTAIGLSLAILPTGKVELLGALGFDAEVTSCMARVIERVAFPRAPGGEVTHTFVPITIEAHAR